MADMARPQKAAFLIALLVFLADQLVKYWVTEVVRLRAAGLIEILPIFNLRWVENPGVSMGFLTAETDFHRWLLVIMTGLIAFGVFVWIMRERSRAEAMILGAVLGGALGNILDRARLGYVVDYADLHFGGWQPFYVFNVGDAAISIGVVLLLYRAVFAKGDKPGSEVRDA
ncbi:signal peptidase II [Sphingomonas sp. ID0503]|uniref:signal peptidase II n=1 Tax=Sphingomonas sp. ID0503 TaxID=3399691 RepID=UPI003AFA4FEF